MKLIYPSLPAQPGILLSCIPSVSLAKKGVVCCFVLRVGDCSSSAFSCYLWS
jgi:hypothetical protein